MSRLRNAHAEYGGMKFVVEHDTNMIEHTFDIHDEDGYSIASFTVLTELKSDEPIQEVVNSGYRSFSNLLRRLADKHTPD